MSALDVTLHKVVVDAWLWACALEFEGHKHLMMASQGPDKGSIHSLAILSVWRVELLGEPKRIPNLMFLFCKVFPYSLVGWIQEQSCWSFTPEFTELRLYSFA